MPVSTARRPLASDPVPVTVEPDTIAGLPAMDGGDASRTRSAATWIERLATSGRLAGWREEQPYASEGRSRQCTGKKQERPIHRRSVTSDGFHIVAVGRGLMLKNGWQGFSGRGSRYALLGGMMLRHCGSCTREEGRRTRSAG